MSNSLLVIRGGIQHYTGGVNSYEFLLSLACHPSGPLRTGRVRATRSEVGNETPIVLLLVEQVWRSLKTHWTLS